MTRRVLWPVIAVGALFGCSKSPQPPQQVPPSAERITGSERLGWTQQATDQVELAGFKYAIYVDGARSQLAGVSCPSTGSSAGFECSAPLPKMSAGSHTLNLAAYIDSGTVLESERSVPLLVIVSPSVTTTGTASRVSTAAPATSVGAMRSGLSLSTADGVQLRIDVVARGLDMPTDLAAAPDGRLFVAERDGRIRVVSDGDVRAASAVTLSDIDAGGQNGLLALALDPRFDATHFVYAIYTTRGREGGVTFALARFREAHDTLADRVVLLEEIPASSRPAASMRFGQDGKLYVALDDGGEPANAGDLASFSGKILRMNADATTPDDQAGATPVLSYQLRSPRGFDWQPGSGTIWIVDTAADDATRLSVIATSANRPRRASTIATYAVPSLAGASAAAFYRGNLIPPFRGDLLIASDEGRHIHRIRFNPRDPTHVAATERLLQDVAGGVRVVFVAEDGAIYFCTAHELARITPAG